MKRARIAASMFVAVGTAIGMSVVGFTPANAAPGHPGTPSAPKVLMNETFEHGQTAGGLTKLADYTSTYGSFTADAPWLDAAQGNGLIVDGTTSDPTFGGAGFSGSGTAKLRSLATEIGTINGTSPANTNHAVTAWTASSDPGANKIEFETVAPINLHANGRFLTVAANVGVTSCSSAHPQLNFFLDDGGTETQVNATALDPCGSFTDTDPHATEIMGGRAALFTGNAAGLIIRNGQGTSNGNDHAFDDVRVLDVTPQLDKNFEASGKTLHPGDAVSLVLTVTNTSELGAKTGWDFTDTLPKGLKVAGAATVDCAAATVAAATGSPVVKVTAGSLAAGAKSCSITVPVTSSKAGSFTNSAANITSEGLNAPGKTTVKYAAVKVPADPSVPAGGEGVDKSGLGLGILPVGGLLVALAGFGGYAVRRRASR